MRRAELNEKRREMLSVRNEKIRKEFQKLYQSGLRTEVINIQLSNQFFLSAGTIESIVFNKGVYGEY